MNTADPPPAAEAPPSAAPTAPPSAPQATAPEATAQPSEAAPTPSVSAAPNINPTVPAPPAPVLAPPTQPQAASVPYLQIPPGPSILAPDSQKKVKDAAKVVKKVKKEKGVGEDGKPRKKRKTDEGKEKGVGNKGRKKKDKTSSNQPSNPTRRLPTATSRGDKKGVGFLANYPGAAAMTSTPSSTHPPGYSAQQAAVRDMMRRALEEDQYSALGSIVDTDSSSSEDESVNSSSIILLRHSNSNNSGRLLSSKKVKLDRNFLLSSVKKHMRVEGLKTVQNFDENVFLEDAEDYCDGVNRGISGDIHNNGGTTATGVMYDEEGEELASDGKRIGKRKKKKRSRGTVKRGSEELSELGGEETGSSYGGDNGENHQDGSGGDEEFFEEEESSIFGQTVGSSSATWVECDRCKKWRRLRGVVDARKLPSKWFCSMNKNDPERSKCSAPEEEYDGAMTPESDIDQRTQKHLRIWVRRLHCNEVFENRQGRHAIKRTSAKEPYEWIRCCNPSCGKWRMLLKSMDGQSVLDSCKNREFYCVMNTWDEKVASCGAAQENLPQFGCPPWAMTDED